MVLFVSTNVYSNVTTARPCKHTVSVNSEPFTFSWVFYFLQEACLTFMSTFCLLYWGIVCRQVNVPFAVLRVYTNVYGHGITTGIVIKNVSIISENPLKALCSQPGVWPPQATSTGTSGCDFCPWTSNIPGMSYIRTHIVVCGLSYHNAFEMHPPMNVSVVCYLFILLLFIPL